MNKKPYEEIAEECSGRVFAFLQFEADHGPFIHFPPAISDIELSRRVSWDWWTDDLRYAFVRKWIEWDPPSEIDTLRDLTYTISQTLMPWKSYTGWLRTIWVANEGKEEKFIRALPNGLLERARDAARIAAEDPEWMDDATDEELENHRLVWIQETKMELNQIKTLIAELQVGVDEVEERIASL